MRARFYGPDALDVEALTAGANVETLIEQARAIKPKLAVIGDEQLLPRLREGLAGTGIEAAGRQGGRDRRGVASVRRRHGRDHGRCGDRARAGRDRARRDGRARQQGMRRRGGRGVPRRHRALRRLGDPGRLRAQRGIPGSRRRDTSQVERVTLTASGGPFREWSLERMRAATAKEAVAHPNWSMGAKISVDSATLMNKGLELIEAHFLFALPPDKLDVIVHPQSVVHCLVTYDDGSTLAHLSAPDMRTPIAHALAWPRRIASPSRKLDLAKWATHLLRAGS